jgi:D-alanyl-D-alanine carboxypeptidase
VLSRSPLAMFVVLVFSSTALARSSQSEASEARSFPQPPVWARAAVVMDANSGQVLAAVNPHLRLPMASTTKIMTGLLALQLGHLDDRIKVPKAAFNFESDATVMGLKAGQTVTLRDLLYGLLLPSGADAANTIAIHYAGSEKAFVAQMNQAAQMIGMHDTHYMDTSGLAVKNHYSSAYDLALLAQYASYNPAFMKITATRYYTWNGQTLTNINHVLFWYPGVDGIKPGWISESGLCQVLDARRGGRHIVVAILNTPNLVTDARNLLDLGLRDFSWIQSPLSGDGPAVTISGRIGGVPYTYFVGSGHYIRGVFLTAYQRGGGLTTLGYPRTEPLTEGRTEVQYFQNGALSLSATGIVSRLPIGGGVTSLPTPTPTPRAAATAIPTATSYEGTVQPGKTSSPNKTPTPVKTPTPNPKPTPTPTARPTPSTTPTTTPASAAARALGAFQRQHLALLGVPVTGVRKIHGYSMQIFTYGAIVFDPKSTALSMLPLGDRILSQRNFLPAHPGNIYPGGFASGTVLKAIGWLPSNLSSTAKPR